MKFNNIHCTNSRTSGQFLLNKQINYFFYLTNIIIISIWFLS